MACQKVIEVPFVQAVEAKGEGVVVRVHLVSRPETIGAVNQSVQGNYYGNEIVLW